MEKKKYVRPSIIVKDVYISMLMQSPNPDKINPKYGAVTDIFDRNPGFELGHGKGLEVIDVENEGPWDGID